MGSTIHAKKWLDEDVRTKALERIRAIYERFDDIVISFSGGKDSTATLLCAIDVARELGRLPVKAVFYDEEAIHPPTIEYVERVAAMPEVNLEWYCLPVKHRNACSNEQPFWYCWNPDDRDKWVREMPEQAITEHPQFRFGMSMQDWGKEHFRRENVCVLQGLRAEESLRRYRTVANRKSENYISHPDPGVYFAYPIYDWTSVDVWKLIEVTGADYNRTYDIFNRTEMYGHLLRQRVCPPYGEEPVRGLWVYAECFPDMWTKMVGRVPGAATAARYGNTELYSTGFKPEQTDWRQHIENVLETYQGSDRRAVARVMNEAIRTHKAKTDDPVPDENPHPLSGLSWRFLGKIVTRGDFKGRVIQNMQQLAEAERRKMGITLEEAKERFGR